jgi:hypothetical protein
MSMVLQAMKTINRREAVCSIQSIGTLSILIENQDRALNVAQVVS